VREAARHIYLRFRPSDEYVLNGIATSVETTTASDTLQPDLIAPSIRLRVSKSKHRGERGNRPRRVSGFRKKTDRGRGRRSTGGRRFTENDRRTPGIREELFYLREDSPRPYKSPRRPIRASHGACGLAFIDGVCPWNPEYARHRFRVGRGYHPHASNSARA
jgi:hypothetical protein